MVARCRELGDPTAIFGYVVADMANLSSTEHVIQVCDQAERLFLCISIVLTASCNDSRSVQTLILTGFREPIDGVTGIENRDEIIFTILLVL